MNFPKLVRSAIFVCGLAVWAAPVCAQSSAWDDVWQEKSSSTVSASRAAPATDWNHRVLKRPEPVQAAQRPTPQRWVTPPKVAERMASHDSAPAGASVPSTAPIAEPEVIEPGQIVFDPPGGEGDAIGNEPVAPRGGCAGCGGGGEILGGDCGDCGDCGPCVGVDECGNCCDFGYEVFDGRCYHLLRDLSVFAGADAFKGPPDHGRNGNFGLNEGVGLSGPLGDPWGCGYQVGVNFVQSNFSGAPTITAGDYQLRAAYRRQVFTTAGIFRRALCRGFQWGVAFDYLNDNYYNDYDLKQIRSETGFVLNEVYEIGYFGAYGLGTDRTIDGKLDPTDMFALYIRRNFENGGQGRIWGGATGWGDGLLGADLWVPLGRGFALENRVTYKIPKQGRTVEAQPNESWGFVLQVVWTPGQNAKCQQRNPYRPIFPVADNSLFMVDRLGE